MEAPCQHLEDGKDIKVAKKHECEACMKMVSMWEHLRIRQCSGTTSCCEARFTSCNGVWAFRGYLGSVMVFCR